MDDTLYKLWLYGFEDVKDILISRHFDIAGVKDPTLEQYREVLKVLDISL